MSSTAKEKKESIISDLIQARRKIVDVAYALPPEKQDEVFLGVWSVADLLAHLIGWDYTTVEATKSILEGELPEFYSHRDRDWETYNALMVERHKEEDFTELLYSLETSQRALMGLLTTVPASEFDKDRGIRFERYKVTIARLLEGDAEDEEEHARQIKAFAAGDSSAVAES